MLLKKHVCVVHRGLARVAVSGLTLIIVDPVTYFDLNTTSGHVNQRCERGTRILIIQLYNLNNHVPQVKRDQALFDYF